MCSIALTICFNSKNEISTIRQLKENFVYFRTKRIIKHFTIGIRKKNQNDWKKKKETFVFRAENDKTLPRKKRKS